MKILLVEDEENVAGFIKKGLEEEFFSVDIAKDGELGLSMSSLYTYDLIILDVMLPRIDGLTLCRLLREKHIKTPILMLTGLDAVSNKVAGLESGADDYLTKPFAFSELLARIRSLRRRTADFASKLTIDNLRMDLLSRRVFRGDTEIILSQKEYSILEYLVRNKERILTRIQIMEQIWGDDFNSKTNLVDVYINFLREKIDKGFDTKLIHTVRGAGYVLKVKNDNQDL